MSGGYPQGGANMALEGIDPRSDDKGEVSEAKRMEPMHLRDVPFEVLLHEAKIQREHEKNNSVINDSEEAGHYGAFFKKVFGRDKSAQPGVAPVAPEPPREKHASNDEKRSSTGEGVDIATGPIVDRWGVTEAERIQAQRALRTATWASAFFLITTDILGPYSAPWAFAQLGYGGGVLVFIFFGIIAMYTGGILWYLYLKLDSDKYPVKTYSDIVERIFGKYARHSVNVLQSIQLWFNVGVIILGNGQSLSLIAKGRVCFSVLCLIWTLLGMGLGQIRSLKNFGWVANLAIWMNIATLIIIMAVAAHTPPNFASAAISNQVTQGPVITTGFTNGLPFTDKLLGIMQVVYSYGGAMIFVEIMSEMRRPWDFWKGMIYGQTFIMLVYLFFGAFVYSQQGQFSINPAPNTLGPYWAQVLGNMISLIAGIIAAALYGNIGIKVIYINVLQELFGFPALLSKRGRIIWAFMVIIYWSVAFIIASAVPSFSAISGLVAALCILQFTYTFPPIMHVGFAVIKDAMSEDGPADAHGRRVRVDTWKDFSRWRRGLARNWYIKLFHVLFFLAALATAGLGSYAAILGIIGAFADGAATSFGCKSPV